MSMTKYMHPRNIYKTPPNFKQLAIEYPEFRKYVTQELSGKVSLDFKDIAALRSLSCTLLKKDFGLDVNIPLNKLIPTIPLRLNYILWIEDLMEISKKNYTPDSPIHGIDIGTGASCVYSLIASNKNKWFMVASDIDEDSLKYASDNVQQNGLSSYIKVFKANQDVLLLDICKEDEQIYNFCMCNPPFFATHQDIHFQFKSRKESRPRPKNAFCAAPQEVIVNGGEVDFIKRMIIESQQLQARVKIYTTMVGHASSLQPLKQFLRDVEVVSFKQTEFCQGNTTRWGLAWTFCDIDLRQVPETTLAAQRKSKIQQKHSFHYQIENVPDDITLQLVHSKLEELFTSLEFDFKVKETPILFTYEVEAKANTWSHQRRKRRAAQRNANESGSSNESKDSESKEDTSCPVETTIEMITDLQVKSPRKREYEDEDGYYNNKRLKPDNGIFHMKDDLLLSAKVTLFKDKQNINMDLIWNHGTEKRDVLHQVLQYIKNNLKF